MFPMGTRRFENGGVVLVQEEEYELSPYQVMERRG